MQYTNATSAYHEARFLVHFHLAIRANFERGVTLLFFGYSTKVYILLTYFFKTLQKL